jgi:adenylate cyclase class 2
MAIEYEARVLEIDPAQMTEKILSIGGEKIRESLQRRFVYAVNKQNFQQFIRLRDTGYEVTLTYKAIYHDGIDGTDETEVVVDSFEKTDELLTKLGYTAKWYQENKRISFTLAGAQVEIDQWPQIPPYLEIEADRYEKVIEVAQMLGFDKEQLIGENTLKIYAKYGIDLRTIPDLRFITD